MSDDRLFKQNVVPPPSTMPSYILRLILTLIAVISQLSFKKSDARYKNEIYLFDIAGDGKVLLLLPPTIDLKV